MEYNAVFFTLYFLNLYKSPLQGSTAILHFSPFTKLLISNRRREEIYPQAGEIRSTILVLYKEILAI